MKARLIALSFFAAVLAAALSLAPAGTPSAPPAAQAADKDCSDFKTQRAAQKFFLRHNPKRDPHRLDADGDGIACESLPCPCLYKKPGSGGGGGKGSKPKKPKKPKAKRTKARVVSVVDGDTIRVRFDGKQRKVRLIGIDTPEVYGKRECGGKQASSSLRRLLRRGQKVKLISDPTQDGRDRYGRLLRYVERGGTDVGRKQVARGWARVYVYGGKPFARVKKYRRSQAKAKRAKKGAWGRCGGRF